MCPSASCLFQQLIDVIPHADTDTIAHADDVVLGSIG
jgi:hypothetical protein